MATWRDLPQDVLVRIMMCLNILDVLNGASNVCRVWREACSDPRMWRMIDLSVIPYSDCFHVGPFALTTKASSQQAMRVMEAAMRLSRGAALTFIFNFSVRTGTRHLVNAAIRSTNVTKLVLPGIDFDNLSGFYTAVRHWTRLEFVTVPRCVDPVNLFRALGESCPNLTHLKIMFPLKLQFAEALTDHLPGLTALSIRYTVVYRDAVMRLLDGLGGLEELNLSHVLVVSMVLADGVSVSSMSQDMDDELVRRASEKLRSFVTCSGGPACPRCRGSSSSEDRPGRRGGVIGWYETEEEIWRSDELKCFEI